jgi:hypothetical protein
MYTEYAKGIDEEVLFYEQAERPSNIPMPTRMSYLLFGAWVVICLVGFAVIIWAKMPAVGIIIIAVPTFLLMIMKPTFALCVMMFGLPTGAGVGIGDVLSLDRGIAIAVTISFLLNIMVSQPALHIRNKALWILVGYTIWVLLISLTSPFLKAEMLSAFAIVQIVAFVFIVHLILETNSESAFRWVLRSYVVGALSVITITYITGAAMRTMEEAETARRYAATLGRAVDSNFLAVLIGLAFLTAVYLMVSDRNFFFRIIYLIAMTVFPIMLVKTGSRGGLIALFVTLTSPFLFLKQVLRRPALATTLFLAMIIGAAVIGFLVTHSTHKTIVTERLSGEQLQTSFNTRKELVLYAAKSVLLKPMGTTRFGWLASHEQVPHNDFFYILAIYGIPGAVFFVFFVIMMMLTVKRIPFGLEKFYSRAVVTFLLVSGLSLGQVGQKHYWIFLTIAMACERMARLKNQASEYVESQIDEETAGIDY